MISHPFPSSAMHLSVFFRAGAPDRLKRFAHLTPDTGMIYPAEPSNDDRTDVAKQSDGQTLQLQSVCGDEDSIKENDCGVDGPGRKEGDADNLRIEDRNADST
jgi:hypothetical protein